jgi:hypothetical protein
MTFNKHAIAATFAAVVIGGLTSNPASAAAPVYGWSDISAATHKGSTASGITQVGQTSGEYGRNDVSALTNGSLPMGVKPLAKASVNGYSRNDITAITHN